MDAQQLIDRLTLAGITTLTAAPMGDTPRWIGKSADSLTAIEVVGALEQIRGLGVLAVLHHEHHEEARNGVTLMIDLLRFLAPAWTWSTNWITACLKGFAEERVKIAAGLVPDHQKMGLVGGGEVRLQFLPTTNTISLKVRLGRAATR